MQTTPAENTPADKLNRRTGKCISIVCHAECEAYAFERRMDGYDLCYCGHTRWAHAVKNSVQVCTDQPHQDIVDSRS